MKLQVGQVALAQFQNRSLDTAAQLFKPRHRSIPQPDLHGAQSARIRIRHQDFQQAQAEPRRLEHSTEVDLAALAEKENSSNR